mmetsp:Transcript_5153/g.16198  ORF Transcript_5153/g.16198 Transcript_5153/m.16198 type:complete len:398 (-) Transcript_5153:13-1206(-)
MESVGGVHVPSFHVPRRGLAASVAAEIVSSLPHASLDRQVLFPGRALVVRRRRVRRLRRLGVVFVVGRGVRLVREVRLHERVDVRHVRGVVLRAVPPSLPPSLPRRRRRRLRHQRRRRRRRRLLLLLLVVVGLEVVVNFGIRILLGRRVRVVQRRLPPRTRLFPRRRRRGVVVEKLVLIRSKSGRRRRRRIGIIEGQAFARGDRVQPAGLAGGAADRERLVGARGTAAARAEAARREAVVRGPALLLRRRRGHVAVRVGLVLGALVEVAPVVVLDLFVALPSRRRGLRHEARRARTAVRPERARALLLVPHVLPRLQPVRTLHRDHASGEESRLRNGLSEHSRWFFLFSYGTPRRHRDAGVVLAVVRRELPTRPARRFDTPTGQLNRRLLAVVVLSN